MPEQIEVIAGSIPVAGCDDRSHIKVKSTSREGQFHYVMVNDDTGTVEKCDCEAFGHRPGPCKHMRAVIQQRLLQRG